MKVVNPPVQVVRDLTILANSESAYNYYLIHTGTVYLGVEVNNEYP